MNFEKSIQDWVALDNQLKKLNEKAKILRGERNTIADSIYQYVEEKNLSNAVVKINDGKLRFVSSKQTAPLTLKYVQECLTKCIPNEEHVNHIMSIIRDSREIKENTDIKRTYN